MMNEVKYLIWSVEHDAYWRENGWGYTDAKRLAGRYTKDAASKILEDANRFSIQEIMIPDQSI